MRLIDADALIKGGRRTTEFCEGIADAYDLESLAVGVPIIDAVPVVRCRDCIHYHPAHIKCPDGSEKGYDEMPLEAFDELGIGLVNLEYGINVGGQCEVEKYSGYSVDKSVYREPDDFCSRGKRKEALNDDPKDETDSF